MDNGIISKLPLVSILIPTFNQADFIMNAINSAVQQDYPKLEVIVSDDCSTDDTRAIAEKYSAGSKVKYFKNKTNLGRVKNYKKCLEEYANGEWVVNLDGDDYYRDNHFVSEVIEVILAHEGQNIVFAQGGKIRRLNNKSVSDLPKIDESVKLLKGEDYFFQFSSQTHFSHMATIYNRKIALDLDFYRYDIASSDLESFLRLALHGNVILIKKAFGEWLQHKSNFSDKVNFFIKKKNMLFINSCHNYALQKGLDEEKLRKWKKDVTVNYLLGWLLKISANGTFLDLSIFLKYVWLKHKYFFTHSRVFKGIVNRALGKKK